MTGSLAYRKNEDAILRGRIPEKYSRLLPFIPGNKIIEIGSAEGVLALLLAKQGRRVTAIERSLERHLAAINLSAVWRQKEKFSAPNFVLGNVLDHMDELENADTLVAIRVVYHLRDDIHDVFAAASINIPNVVLCGNRGRGEQWRSGVPDEPCGPLNYYSSSEGMRDLLTRHGYTVVREEPNGDPIVVGRK